MKPKKVLDSWYRANESLFNDSRLAKMQKSLSKIKFTPAGKDIFKPFSFFEYSSTKVVILNTAPNNNYRNGNYVSNGLAFGVHSEEYDTKELSVIRDSLSIDCSVIDVEDHFDWSMEFIAKQEVLLLNCALTSPLRGDIHKHIPNWNWFISGILKNLANNLTGLIFVAVGDTAKAMIKNHVNDSMMNHHYLETCHPETTAKYIWKEPKPKDDFKSYHIFDKINQIMYKTNGIKIQFLYPF